MGGVGMGGGSINSVWSLRIVGGAVKEGKCGNVTIYREDFSEEVGGVDEAGEEDRAEKLLAYYPSTNRDACRLTWTSSGGPKKSQDQSHIRCRQIEGDIYRQIEHLNRYSISSYYLINRPNIL